MHVRRSALCLLAALPLVVVPTSARGSSSGRAPTTASCDWNVVRSPNIDLGIGRLNAVAAFAPGDVWAVGSASAFNSERESRTLTERWNGNRWSVVDSPSPPHRIAVLNGVAGTSASDVWAVGESTLLNFPSAFHTLVLHWNGHRWVDVPAADAEPARSVLRSVTAIGQDDAWAVGSSDDGTNTLTERWDGSAWTVVPSPSPNATGNQLLSVDAVSSTDVWAVGAGGPKEPALIEHWDGSSWQVVPAHGGQSALSGVTALATDDVWAVGVTSTGASLVERWRGSSWAIAGPSDTGPLTGVAASGAADVWAVGAGQEGVSAPAIRNRGAGWHDVHTPPAPAGFADVLHGVAPVAPDDAWAVGEQFGDPHAKTTPESRALIERWDGSHWSMADAPPVGGGNNLAAVSAAPGGRVWAAGGTATTGRLVERSNGSTPWLVAASPSRGKYDQHWTGAAARAADDVWLVGTDDGGFSGATKPISAHWNGSRWTFPAVPKPRGAQEVVLAGVSADAPDDVWAVGEWFGGMVRGATLIEHWNGARWTVVSSPGVTSAGLNGVLALSPTNVWVVGSRFDPSKGGIDATLVEHWNGADWTIVPSPTPGGQGGELLGVGGNASKLFAVGRAGVRALILHRVQGRWRVESGGSDQGPGIEVVSVAAVPDGDVWAVGDQRFGTSGHTAIIEHRVDGQWSFEPVPPPLSAVSSQLLGIAVVPGTRRLYAVGDFQARWTTKTLVLRHC